MRHLRILVSGCTKTVNRLANNHADYLGHLITPANWNSIPVTSLPYAVDNGAFSGFVAADFRAMLSRLSAARKKPLWVACPDVVGSAAETLALWPEWSMTIRSYGFEPAFVLQDQQRTDRLPDARAYFIGGSDSFKHGCNLFPLVAEAKRRGALLHMGRVNTRRRLRCAWDMGCDTVDGTGWSRWGDARLPSGIRWIKQLQAQGLLLELCRLGEFSEWAW